MSYRNDIKAVANLDLPWGKLDGCNILVTGASGLIGSCLVDVLMSHPNKSYTVFALGRNVQRLTHVFSRFDKDESLKFIQGDVTESIKDARSFHYIVHAASGAAPNEFVNHPVEVMKANILGLMNLMEYGLDHNMRRLLFVSSGEVYGEGDGRVFGEEYSGYVDSMKFRSCYPSSKRAAETLCSCYASEYNADVVVVRPCHVYGPYFSDTDNRVYAQFIRNVLQNEDIILKSTGEQFRSWCYVVDCVSALLYVLLKGNSGEAYNIADSESNISIRELAETIADIYCKRVIITLPDFRESQGYNQVRKSVFSTDKIEALGWRVSSSIREKIRSTIQERIEYERKRDIFK